MLFKRIILTEMRWRALTTILGTAVREDARLLVCQLPHNPLGKPLSFLLL